MNIARANRCETFAIPSKELLAVVEDLMNSHRDGDSSQEKEASPK